MDWRGGGGVKGVGDGERCGRGLVCEEALELEGEGGLEFVGWMRGWGVRHGDAWANGDWRGGTGSI
jgi:hypothetical protein